MVPYQGSQGEAKTEEPTATAPPINFQRRLNTALDMASLEKPWVLVLLKQYRAYDMLQLITKLYFLGYNSNDGVIRGNCCWRTLLLDTITSPRCSTRYKCSAQYWYNSSRGWAKQLSRKLTGPQLQELASWQGPGKGNQTRYCWYLAGRRATIKAILNERCRFIFGEMGMRQL